MMSKESEPTRAEWPNEKTAKTKKPFWREWGEALFVAAILALIIRTFVIQAFKIPSGSMEDTLLIGDHLLVNKFIYGMQVPFRDSRFLTIRHPQRGDIIVFEFPEDKGKSYFQRRISSSESLVRRGTPLRSATSGSMSMASVTIFRKRYTRSRELFLPIITRAISCLRSRFRPGSILPWGTTATAPTTVVSGGLSMNLKSRDWRSSSTGPGIPTGTCPAGTGLVGLSISPAKTPEPDLRRGDKLPVDFSRDRLI
jgi:signal peptidase I